MGENTVELFDYLSDYLKVIWKRKIIIIVLILFSIGVGVGVGVKNMRSNLKVKPQVTYYAEAFIKIGKRVKLIPASGITSSIEYIESPNNLVTRFPLDHYAIISKFSKYRLNVELVGTISMIKLTLKGRDKGVERALEELVDTLVVNHRKKAEDSVVAYKNFMENLEEDAENLKKDIIAMKEGIKKMKRKEGEYLVIIESSKTKGMDAGGDRSAFLNMLYLKTIDKERELGSRQAVLRSIQQKLLMHRITLGNLEEYKTKLVGGINIVAETIGQPKKKELKHTITVAAVAGLIMSLFIAFFIEYIHVAKSRRKGK